MVKNTFKLTLLMCVALEFALCVKTESGGSKNAAVGKEFAQTVTKDSAVICWDPPAEGKDSVSYYELFYRCIHDSGWTMVKREIPSVASPCVTVYKKDVDMSVDSAMFFGVRSVGKNGLKSDFNFSSDTSESWYVVWR